MWNPWAQSYHYNQKKKYNFLKFKNIHRLQMEKKCILGDGFGFFWATANSFQGLFLVLCSEMVIGLGDIHMGYQRLNPGWQGNHNSYSISTPAPTFVQI